ncbi:MAG: DUF5103 domain-containing protein [Dysgonamonadaceae bacterium]|jgi:hypothetical protein|nr:DUF5103 domain-containing protein [Dysgonamonadaceae bacterium]
MFKRIFISILLFISCVSASYSQEFKTGIFSGDVYTLRVNPLGQPLDEPVIRLGSNDLIEINFDLLTANPERLTYTLTHCNADNRPSQLLQSEYMSGFQGLYVDDYVTSFNTTRDYVNYRLVIPNDNVNILVSGNYAVNIYPENSDKPILTACFSVTENAAKIEGGITTQTDRGMNTTYQAVNFAVTCGNEVATPLQDLKIFVRQNGRSDNEAVPARPLGIQNRTLTYEHIPALIFEAGNEYRSFEMLTHRYDGMNIERISFQPPYYHVFLKESQIRSDRSYFYENDINGRFTVRNLDSEDFDSEADYYIVHFFLPCGKPFRDDVYILGRAFNNNLDWRSRMDYDAEAGGYVKTVPMKEGYYNFLYVTAPNNHSPASCSAIEGNFYQTENEYRILVYFRPPGARYDRLLATNVIQK